MKVLELPAAWRDRAMIIVEAADIERFFTDEELDAARAFPLPKRQAEWLLSRTAAKELALRRGVIDDPRHCVIGRPQLVIDGTPSPWFVSLSHSSGFAGAAIDTTPVGMDVERRRDLTESAAHLFLTDEEADAMKTTRVADRLIHFWAAKEAIYKQHQGAFGTLKRVPIRLIGESENALIFDGAETVATGGVIAALTRATS